MDATERKYYRVIAARKDVSARGRVREWWYRMIYDSATDTWRYLASRRLPTGTFLAADRHAEEYADVAVGDIIAQHARGGPVDAVYLVSDKADRPLLQLRFRRVTGGRLSVTMPDESVLDLPDPRR